MASIQRRRGLIAKVWKTEIRKDARGNDVITPVPLDPHEVRVAAIPQRSSKAEVPGQQQINIMRIIADANMPGVNLWSRVEMDGKVWDVASPPAFHYGTRQVRHWSIDLRERP